MGRKTNSFRTAVLAAAVALTSCDHIELTPGTTFLSITSGVHGRIPGVIDLRIVDGSASREEIPMYLRHQDVNSLAEAKGQADIPRDGEVAEQPPTTSAATSGQSNPQHPVIGLLDSSNDQCSYSWNTCENSAYDYVAGNDLSWYNMVPCRDCAAPGQKCNNATVCSDDMVFGFEKPYNYNKSFPANHPRNDIACQLNTHSRSCINATYNYCCVPGTPSCPNSAPPSCSAYGCTQFLQRGSSNQPITASCPFSNSSATCGLKACQSTTWKAQITSIFLAGKITCSTPACSFNQLIQSCRALFPRNGTNGTNATGSGPAITLPPRRLLRAQYSPAPRILLSDAFDPAVMYDKVVLCANSTCNATGLLAMNDTTCGNATFGSLANCTTSDCFDSIVANPDNCTAWGDFVACANVLCFADNSYSYNDSSNSSNSSWSNVSSLVNECATTNCSTAASIAFSDASCGNASLTEFLACSTPDCFDQVTNRSLSCDSFANFYVCFLSNCTNASSYQWDDSSAKSTNYSSSYYDFWYYHYWHYNTTHYNHSSYNGSNNSYTDGGSGGGGWIHEDPYYDGYSMDNQTKETLGQIDYCSSNTCLEQATNAYYDWSCGSYAMYKLRSCTNMSCLEAAGSDDSCESFTAFARCSNANCSYGAQFRLNQGFLPSDPQSCPSNIASYCTAHPEDIGCTLPCPFNCYSEASCPCQDPACGRYTAAPFCVREIGVCADFKSALAKKMYAHGAFSPMPYWYRQPVQQYLIDPVPYNASNDTSLRALWDACNQAYPHLADDTATCLNTSITYCNNVGSEQACNPGVGSLGVSECGDGFVTWGEDCDDGNTVGGDGCSSSCRVENPYNWACLQQGQPCIQCTRDTIQLDSNGQPVPGQFCLNDRLVIGNETVPFSSPVHYPSCASISSIDDAIACDIYANSFCANLTAQNTSDPACQPYVNLTRAYTVPTVGPSCEYVVKSMDIGSQSISSAKVAVFTCKYRDPYGILSKEDATPVFKYTNPYKGLTSDWKKKISANTSVSAIVDTLYGARNDMFYSVKDVRITDYFGEAFPEFHMKDGDIPFNFSPLAQLSLFLPNSTIPAQANASGDYNPNCGYDYDSLTSVDIFPVPPTKEPTKWVLKMLLLHFRYQAVARNDNSMQDFAKFNAWSIKTTTELLDGVLNFGVLLSTSSKDSNGKVQENVQRYCSDWSVSWDQQATSPLCTTVEKALHAGSAFIKFNQNLFQKGCKSDQCTYKVDHCRRVPLVNHTIAVDPVQYAASAADLVSMAANIDNATSWGELVGNTVKVAVQAAGESIADPLDLFWSLVVKGKQTVYLKNVPNYCQHDYWNDTSYTTVNPKWTADPCCNWNMRQYYCCAPQDIPNGEIDVVVDTNDVAISTYCPGVGAQVRDVLQSTMKALSRASSCSDELDKSTGFDSWQAMAKVSSTCSDKIYKASDKTCKKDSDCTVCSQSTCYKQQGKSSGTCTVPWDDIEGCTLECYQNTMDSDLLRYLYDQWGLSVTASVADKKAKFTEMMAEPTCSGQRMYESDIGRNGWTWQTNMTCLQQNFCDDWDYQSYLQYTTYQDSWTWLNFQDNETCIAYNGTYDCAYTMNDGTCYYYTCTFPNVQGPCKAVSQCYDKCQLPYTADGCASLNGTWYLDTYGSGRCCPLDAYFNVSGTNSICSYAPPNSPSAGSITEETCCAAAGGKWWTFTNWFGSKTGSCCFGKLVPYTDPTTGDTTFNCHQDFQYWDTSPCYEECNAKQADCNQCRLDNQACSGYVHTYANKTACLSYKQCNQAQYNEDDCAGLVGDQPFCSVCWGQWCYNIGQPAACTYYIWDSSSCASANGEWDWNTYRCYVNGTRNNGTVDPWSCFSPGASVCPNPLNTSSNYGPDDVVPMFSFTDVRCDAGCYLTSVNSTSCANDSYWSIQWKPSYANGSGACSIDSWEISSDECANLGGVYVATTLAYNDGQWNTQDKCAQGYCQGGLGWDGWSRQQCESSTKFQCDHQCEQCTTWSWPYYNQDGGGCFSNNATFCDSLGSSSTPCLVSQYTSSAECAKNNQTLWKTCSSYNATACGNTSDPFISLMNCQLGWDQCSTQESCEAQGECNDWDSTRQQCNDNGWAYGDTCYASGTVNTFDNSTNSTTSLYYYAYCNSCSYEYGVCIKERPPEGCLDNMWHTLGCRVDGVHNKANCDAYGKSSNTTTLWKTKAQTKADCESVQTCDEPGWYGVNYKSEAECAKCGGSGKSFYTWTSGVWSRPTVMNLTWMANGTQLIPVNQWKMAVSDWKVNDQLTLPLVRKMANAKKTQTLLTYNAFSSSLGVIACACGGNPDNASSCFDQTGGSVEGITDAFCGSSAPINAGCGKAVVKKDCSSFNSTQSRRLTGGKVVGSSDKLSITTTYYSAGPYAGTYEPFCDATSRKLLNTLAVKNSQGVVYGQLMGDGKGLKATSSFGSISLCLDLSLDIRTIPDRFPTPDVASLVNNAFVPLYVTSFATLNSKQMCFDATQSGIYFPIYRLNLTQTAVNQLTCSQSCVTANSICVASATSSSTSCVCNCGFSGATCSVGCVNNCNSKGLCNNNVCVCNKGWTGVDCSEYDCPTGSNGKRCSGNGACLSNATCACNANYKSADCSQIASLSTGKIITLPKGLGPAKTPTTPSKSSPATPKPTSSPTPQPTNAPTPSPSKSTPPPAKETPPSPSPSSPAPSPSTPKPTNTVGTFPPAPKLTTAPPLPAIASTCIADKCKAAYATCKLTFDDCACIPGQLLCAQTNCSTDFADATAQCTKLAASATSCVLNCNPQPYPSTTSGKLTLAVVTSVAVKGVAAADFTTTMQDKFKEAVAQTITGVSADKVTIISITEVPDVRRRLDELNTLTVTAGGDVNAVKRILKQQATGTRLEIKFSITVDTPAALQATQTAMLDQSGSGSTPSTLSQALISTGALPPTAVIQVQSVQTAVNVPPPKAAATPAPSTSAAQTSAPTTATPPSTSTTAPTTTAAPTDSSSNNTTVIAAAVGGSIGALIIIGCLWRFFSMRKQRTD
ncbi:unnamed protein product [Aphanomyces euteiches]